MLKPEISPHATIAISPNSYGKPNVGQRPCILNCTNCMLMIPSKIPPGTPIGGKPEETYCSIFQRNPEKFKELLRNAINKNCSRNSQHTPL